jgi:[ribosomal protein S5]-alanine N-acetyltransferase
MTRWPVIVRNGELQLQPLRIRDWQAWTALRARNAEWLRPWDATTPRPDVDHIPAFPELIQRYKQQARAGQSLPWALWHRAGTPQATLIGQVTVSGIVGGAARLCHIGYWIDQEYAGRGFMPRAVAMACRYIFEDLDLHRIEIAIRPENVASLRVVEKLGFVYEGRRSAFLHIAGDWRDHDIFSLRHDEIADGSHPICSFWAETTNEK